MTKKEKYHSTTELSRLIQSHFSWGWWMLFAFLTLGFLLEALHGFKAGFYLDASSEARRLMWTLAHAHGTLLAVVHLMFATFLNTRFEQPHVRMSLASRSLKGGSIILPAGFFFAGFFIYDGDPGLFIYLAPVGALLLMFAVFLIARSALASNVEEEQED